MKYVVNIVTLMTTISCFESLCLRHDEDVGLKEFCSSVYAENKFQTDSVERPIRNLFSG